MSIFVLHNEKAFELIENTYKTNNNDITFKPLTSRNKRGKPQIALKRDSNGVLQCNDAKSAEKAVEQFKQLINEIQKEEKDRDETARNMPMVDTTVEYKSINGLTEGENRELEGVLSPPESIDKSTRQEFLKVQLDNVDKTLDKTIEERDNRNNPEEYIELEERIMVYEKLEIKPLNKYKKKK